MPDIKKLMRGALEPARVFGRRDFDPKAGQELLHYCHNGRDFWSPGWPTWMVADGDCRVLEKAIQRYGFREAPINANGSGFEKLLEGGPVSDWSLCPPGAPFNDYCLLKDYELTVSGVVFPGFSVNGTVYPATPVAYAQRRWGDAIGEYRSDGDFLRILVDGEVVVVVRSIASDRLKVWTAAQAA